MAVFFLHNSQSIRQFSPKNRQATGLEDYGWGKPITRLTKVFTFQRVGLARCGHTAVCGDKERSERERLGEEMPSHFNTLLQRKGKLAFQVFTKCEAIQEQSQNLPFIVCFP